MKHFLAAGSLCLLFAATAGATTLTIGRARLVCTVPAEYMEVQEEPYLSMRRSAEASAPELRIHALYVERKAHERFAAGEASFPDRYVFLASLPALDRPDLDVADFAEIRQGIAAARPRLTPDATPRSVREDTRSAAGNQPRDGMAQGDIPEGVFEETDTSLSFLTLAEQTIPGESGALTIRQAAASTYLLASGKIVVVTQYRNIEPAGDVPAQLDDFRREAPDFIRRLDIAPAASKTGTAGLLGKALFGALFGGLVGFTVVWIRRKMAQRG